MISKNNISVSSEETQRGEDGSFVRRFLLHVVVSTVISHCGLCAPDRVTLSSNSKLKFYLLHT